MSSKPNNSTSYADYTKIFHTIPLRSQLITRDSNNKKVDETSKPLKYPGDATRYQTAKNSTNSPVLAAIALKDFIGVDVDNTALMMELLPLAEDTAAYIAMALPLGINKGGHILFSYNKGQAQALKPLVKYLAEEKIDVQMGAKNIYLATPANHTKKLMTPPLTALADLTPMPEMFFNKLVAMVMPMVLAEKTPQVSLQSEYPQQMLGYLLENTLTPDIVGKLTPKIDFPLVVEMNDIKDGTEWMNQVRQKLMSDDTVSEDVMLRTMHYVNSLWDDPMDDAKVVSDCQRDFRHKTWVYNPSWKASGYTFSSKKKETIEVLYDTAQKTCIEHNKYTDNVTLFTPVMGQLDSILAQGKKKVTKDELLKKAETVTLVDTPELPPRLVTKGQDSPKFNIYTPSEGVKILTGQIDPPSTQYPAAIMGFLEGLIPHKESREMFLKFIVRKHTTYEHSPLYFLMAGPGGAGKGLFLTLILAYFTGDRHKETTLKDMTNNFNSWQVRTDWVMLSEVTESMSKKQKQELVVALKQMSGTPLTTIEKKGKDQGKPERHYMSFILSTNVTDKLITATTTGERRMVFLRCPNIIPNTLIPDMVEKMTKELPQFAYYLSLLDPIAPFDYIDNKSWRSDDYYEYVEASISHSDRLLQAIENCNMKAIVDTLVEAYVPQSDIDSLFSLPGRENAARIVFKSTRVTRARGAKSLHDICEENAHLDTSIIRSVHSKIRSTVDGGNVYFIPLEDQEYTAFANQVADIPTSEEIKI